MTYHEIRYGYYKSPFEVDQQTWYHTWSPNDTHYLENNEFKYKRTTNSLGLSDVEPRLRTDTNEIRILTLGDSFTEGDGAPYDSSYPQLLKDIVATKYPNAKFTVINAGVSGSDPYYDYVTFRDKLMRYQPDIVLCTISENDLLEIYYRGGINRFNKDGTVSYNTAPIIEPAIAISTALRLFTVPFYRKSTIPRWQQKEIFDSEIESLSTIYKSMDSIGGQHNFKVHLLIRPDAIECEKGEYSYDYSYLVSEINELPTTTYTDLLEMYKAAGATGDNTYKYYWPNDKHHTSAGYKVMAESVFMSTSPLIDTLVATRYSAK